jgi:hypothetical protein
MVEATISCVRLPDLARLGRSRLFHARCAGPEEPSASRRPRLTDATSIGESLPPRPRAASSRPGDDDLVASTISRTRP